VNVRELRTTDISCSTCGVGPGEFCKVGMVKVNLNPSHRTRTEEAESLRRAGWQWQEVDPRDDGAPRSGK